MRLRESPKNWFYCLAAIVAGAVFGLFLSSFTGTSFAADDEPEQPAEISTQRYVTFYADGDSLTVKTDAKTVEEALARTDLIVNDTDIIEPSKDTLIDSDNFKVNIYRSRPVVVTDGITRKYIMTASYDDRTIAESAGFTVYDGDVLTTEVNTNLLETNAAAVIRLDHNGGETVTTTEEIPYEETTVRDASMDAGKTEVRTVGEVGEKTLTYRIKFVDGKEAGRELVSETVTRAPVAQVTAIGAKAVIPPSWETCASYARAAGVSEADLYDALYIINKESHCRYNATNAYSGAYGIPQALPGSKMASAGADWETNPVTQIRWMNGYVSRYGGWAGARAFWDAHRWY